MKYFASSEHDQKVIDIARDSDYSPNESLNEAISAVIQICDIEPDFRHRTPAEQRVLSELIDWAVRPHESSPQYFILTAFNSEVTFVFRSVER